MTFFSSTSLRRAIQTCAIFLATTTVAAQSCYYPDGSPSSEVPCGTGGVESSCCGASEFCLSSGLCLSGGVVSRGSCTDKNWESDACTEYCRTVSPSTGIAITPCTSDNGTDTFVCGLNSTDCQTDTNTWVMTDSSSLVLRPAQIVALLGSALENETSTPTACASSAVANTTTTYTSGQMAGLGCGLGIPLGLALLAALVLLNKEKQKHAPPKLMYKLPDNHTEFSFRPPPGLRSQSSISVRSHFSDTRPSTRRQSVGTTITVNSMPAHMQSFTERYETMKKHGRVTEQDLGCQRHELDGSLPQHNNPQYYELAEKRMS